MLQKNREIDSGLYPFILDENGEMCEQEIFEHDRLLSFWELCEGEGFYAYFYEGDTLLVPKETKWNKN